MKLKYKSLLLLSLLGSSLALNTTSEAAVLGDNYPNQWKSGYGADSWGMYLRQCTSFVAFRLSSANGFSLPRGYGNAISWGSVARSQGYRVDMTPTVGSVAWFSAGVNDAGGYGHVAWVAEVNGDSVTIEEYNYDCGQGPEKYYRRSFHKSQVSGYIHFKDLGGSTVTSSPSVQSPPSSSTALSSSGIYTFTSRHGIKYDKTVISDGYEWLSYFYKKD